MKIKFSNDCNMAETYRLYRLNICMISIAVKQKRFRIDFVPISRKGRIEDSKQSHSLLSILKLVDLDMLPPNDMLPNSGVSIPGISFPMLNALYTSICICNEIKRVMMGITPRKIQTKG